MVGLSSAISLRMSFSDLQAADSTPDVGPKQDLPYMGKGYLKLIVRHAGTSPREYPCMLLLASRWQVRPSPPRCPERLEVLLQSADL